MSKSEAKALEKNLFRYNKLYREGKPRISDQAYDSLVEKLRELNPSSDFFKRGIVEKSTDSMVDLPIRMGSLDKLKSLRELRRWVESLPSHCNLVITPKFDGISLLVAPNINMAYTRGDGFKGQRRPEHFKSMYGYDFNSTPNCKSAPYRHNAVGPLIWGEAIMESTVDLEHEDGHYKDSRNAVAGIFNSPDGYKNKLCKKIDFMAYGSNIQSDTKHGQLDYLSKFTTGIKVSSYSLITRNELLVLNDKVLMERFEFVKTSMAKPYRTDGVVIEVDDMSLRDRMGRKSTGNPAYAMALKLPEWDNTYTTTVRGIEYSVSKDGLLKPVIVTEPVNMNGVTVDRATGYNGKYLRDNYIQAGSIIKIIRSGGVIPKHVGTVSHNVSQIGVTMPTKCPICGHPVIGHTEVDLVCINPRCRGRRVSGMVYFFETLGCEGFSEPTLQKLYDNGFRTLYGMMSHISKGGTFKKYIGKARSKALIDEVKKYSKPPLAQYMTALNVFSGKIATNTAQAIIQSIGEKNMKYFLECRDTEKMKDFIRVTIRDGVNGVGDVKMEAFINGAVAYNNMMHDKKLPVIEPIAWVTPKEVSNGMGICFTGFRDKALEEELISRGFTILDNVTKECSILVAKDPNESSNKIQRAQKNHVRIMSIGELRDII